MKIMLKRLRTLIREAIEQQESGEENKSGKKELVVLVGPPGVGKSTYIAKKFPKGSVVVISRDDLAEQAASSAGLTYDDLFVSPGQGVELGSLVKGMEKFGEVVKSPDFMTWAPLSYENILNINNEINAALQAKFDSIASSDKHVVIDMTNMNAGARKSALGSVGENDFFKRAVVFKVGDSDLGTLKSRLEQRAMEAKAQGRSKTIDPSVIDRMMKSFQSVSGDEGFDKIDSVDTFTPL